MACARTSQMALLYKTPPGVKTASKQDLVDRENKSQPSSSTASTVRFSKTGSHFSLNRTKHQGIQAQEFGKTTFNLSSQKERKFQRSFIDLLATLKKQVNTKK